MVTHVFDICPSGEGGYPALDFSREPNRGFDWLAIAAMIDGQAPIDVPYLDKVDLLVENQGQPFDALALSGRMMFSERVRRCIESLNIRGLEWVPLRVNGQPYHVVSRAVVINCLDYARSECMYFPSNPEKVMIIRKYAFNKTMIPDKAIFRIPERLFSLFFSPMVKSHLESNEFQGFRFVDIENPPAGMPIG